MDIGDMAVTYRQIVSVSLVFYLGVNNICITATIGHIKSGLKKISDILRYKIILCLVKPFYIYPSMR
jgi:hypothetical protein